MTNQRVSAIPVLVRAAIVGWARLLAVVPAMAQKGSGDYILLIASGFLCDSGDSSACPAVVSRLMAPVTRWVA